MSISLQSIAKGRWIPLLSHRNFCAIQIACCMQTRSSLEYRYRCMECLSHQSYPICWSQAPTFRVSLFMIHCRRQWTSRTSLLSANVLSDTLGKQGSQWGLFQSNTSIYTFQWSSLSSVLPCPCKWCWHSRWFREHTRYDGRKSQRWLAWNRTRAVTWT